MYNVSLKRDCVRSLPTSPMKEISPSLPRFGADYFARPHTAPCPAERSPRGAQRGPTSPRLLRHREPGRAPGPPLQCSSALQHPQQQLFWVIRSWSFFCCSEMHPQATGGCSEAAAGWFQAPRVSPVPGPRGQGARRGPHLLSAAAFLTVLVEREGARRPPPLLGPVRGICWKVVLV